MKINHKNRCTLYFGLMITILSLVLNNIDVDFFISENIPNQNNNFTISTNNHGNNQYEFIPVYSVLRGPKGMIGFGSSLANIGDVLDTGVDNLIVGGSLGEYQPPDYQSNNFYREYNFFIPGSENRTYENKQITPIKNCSKNWYQKNQRWLGDVNGDGIEDFLSTPLIKEPWDLGHYQYIPAKLHIRYGSREGLPETPDTVITVGVEGRIPDIRQVVFGGVNDVNGDGFNDLCVYQYSYQFKNSNYYTTVPAYLELYYGSTAGLPTNPEIKISINISKNRLWSNVGKIYHADLNGDGYSDVIFSNTTGPPIHIHYGSIDGLNITPDQILSFGMNNSFYFSRIHTPLNLNGDDFDDFIIEGSGMYWKSDYGEKITDKKNLNIYIYHGSHEGIIENPNMEFNLPCLYSPTEIRRSRIITSDINGDELDDLVYQAHWLLPESPPQIDVLNEVNITLGFHFNQMGTFNIEPDWRYAFKTTGSRVESIESGDFDNDGNEDVVLGIAGDYWKEDSQQDYIVEAGSIVFVYGGGVLNYLSPVVLLGGPRLYAGYRAYDFIVNTNHIRDAEIPDNVRLILDPEGANETLLWRGDNKSDPFYIESINNHHIKLESTPKDSVIDLQNNTIWLHFKVIIDWSWPHEDLCNVMLEKDYSTNQTIKHTINNLFSVENDLTFYGNPIITGEWQGSLNNGDWIRKDETITITGLKVVYEGTIDIYPPSDIFNISLKDNDGDKKVINFISGEIVNLSIVADQHTDINEKYILTFENTPGNADIIYEPTFPVKVDGDFPIFCNPIPESDDWHSSSNVFISITVDDAGTSGVDASTLDYSYSIQGAQNYGEWTRKGLITTEDGEIVDGLVELELPDGNDSYIRWRVRDVVGNSIVSPNFQIKVDTHNVTFTSPIPPTYEWQKQLENTCGITIRDIEGSGINTNTIQYRFSHNNLSHYGDWYFWSADSINISQVISVVVTLELNESPFNYIQWRAMDIAGNGFTTSPHYKVRTDITPINFSNFTPIEAVFMNASEILCSITITDNSRGSWVDASTIEYRVKLNNEDYLDWIPGSWQGIFKNITIWLEITCSEGTDNFVQFRGHDVAGNGPTISREYRISVDMTGPEFILISPDENEKHSNTDLTVSIQFTDVQTNINISSVYYRYGRKDYFITDWTSMRIHLEEEKYIGNVMITFEKGRDNIIQFKASDIVGNEALSVLFSIWINSFPKAFISSPVQNETYNDLEKVILYANGTEDPDNDVLNYTWLLEGYSVPIAYGKEASVRLHVGIQNISLIVRDDFGEEDRAEVTITVVHGPQKIKDQDNLIVIFLLIMMICIILSLVLLFYSHKHS